MQFSFLYHCYAFFVVFGRGPIDKLNFNIPLNKRAKTEKLFNNNNNKMGGASSSTIGNAINYINLLASDKSIKSILTITQCVCWFVCISNSIDQMVWLQHSRKGFLHIKCDARTPFGAVISTKRNQWLLSHSTIKYVSFHFRCAPATHFLFTLFQTARCASWVNRSNHTETKIFMLFSSLIQ